MFEGLTKYLDRIESKDWDKWFSQKEEELERDEIDWYDLEYSWRKEIGSDLSYAAYEIIDNHEDELQIHSYSKVVKEYGINPGIPMRDELVKALDARGVMVSILFSLRGNRFCDGYLMGVFRNGNMEKWIRRLKEIDEENSQRNIS